MKGVVLAAGIGKRMRPVTDRMPKPMVPIANRPVLEHVALGLREAGVDDLLVVVNYKQEQIRAYFGDGSAFGMRIQYLHQENPAGGTGAAALLGEEFVAGEPFLLTFGDLMLTPANYVALVDTYRQAPTSGRITANWIEDPSAGAAITIGANERMVKIVEKPPKGTAESNWNNAGIFVFSPAIFDAIRRIPLSPRGELELTAAIQLLAHERGDVTVYRLEGLWSDVGWPAKILDLNRQILANPALGVPVARGPVPAGAVVDDGSAVAPGADVVGCEVRKHSCVAAGAAVGTGSVLRDTAVLFGGKVGAGCRLEHAIVLPDAVVPDGASLRENTMEPWLQTTLLIFAALLIGISKAGFGGGPGMLVPPLLALFLPPRYAIGLLLPLLLATDIFALRFYWRRWDTRNVVPILAGAAVGIGIGYLFLDVLSEAQMRKAIGILAVVFAGIQLVRERLVSKEHTMRPFAPLGALVGVVCGVGSTLAHQGGVPITLYLLPQRPDSITFVATTTAIFFFVNAAKVVPYAAAGMLPKEALFTDLWLLPVVFIGTALGVRLNAVVPREWFLRVVLVFVLATGIKLLMG